MGQRQEVCRETWGGCKTPENQLGRGEKERALAHEKTNTRKSTALQVDTMACGRRQRDADEI